MKLIIARGFEEPHHGHHERTVFLLAPEIPPLSDHDVD